MIAVGQHISHYEVTSRIGAGGMGEVFRARDLKLKRDVAIKVLPDSLSSDTNRLVRFQREAEALAALNHPNIAAIHGIEESAGSSCLVLELVEGETLAQVLARGPLPIQDAVAVAKQIAEGLEAAHEKGIIHRDLKPSNVMLLPDGKVKVLDFGLAKIFGEPNTAVNISNSPTIVSQVESGEVVGTPGYMSPEQARSKSVDSKTDIWAFGCLLFELISGKRAFDAESSFEITAKVLEGTPNWPALPANIPGRIRQLLTRCLQRDPHRRIQHIGDVRLELEEVMAGSNSETLEPVVSKRSAVYALIGLGLTTLISSILAISLAWDRPRSCRKCRARYRPDGLASTRTRLRPPDAR